MSGKKFKNYEEEKEYNRLFAKWNNSPELQNEFIDWENFFAYFREDLGVKTHTTYSGGK